MCCILMSHLSTKISFFEKKIQTEDKTAQRITSEATISQAEAAVLITLAFNHLYLTS